MVPAVVRQVVSFDQLIEALDLIYRLEDERGADPLVRVRYVVEFWGVPVLVSTPARGVYPESWARMNGVGLALLGPNRLGGGGEAGHVSKAAA